MPRGIAKTTPGRMNAREAKALAKRIEQEHPGYRASVFNIAQGLARVDVQTPHGTVIVRNEKDLKELEWSPTR